MKNLIIDESRIDYKKTGTIKIKDLLIDIPSKYKGKAITTLFPISTKKAQEIIDCPTLHPAEISFGRTLLSITLFDFYWSPVGPYTELVYSIPIFYKTRINLPFFPLLMNKYFKNFGFFVLDIAQSTEIAIEHGNMITGYPHNTNLIDVVFSEDARYIYIYTVGAGKEVLHIQAEKSRKEKFIQDSYMTYFVKSQKLYKIQMDIYGIESKIKNCTLSLGNHELANLAKSLDIAHASIQTSYFRDVIEINPVTHECL